MKYLFLIVTLFAGYYALGQVPATGVYNGVATVTIFRNEQTKTIYGNFNTCLHDGHDCCAFNFKGEYKALKGKKIKITTSWPDDSAAIKGSITFELDTSFIIKLKHLPPGSTACTGLDKDGYNAKLVQKENWLGINMAKSRKTFFYAEPDVNKRMQAYITVYDIVGVLEYNGDWVKAEYVNYNLKRPVTISGWIKKADLFANAF